MHCKNWAAGSLRWCKGGHAGLSWLLEERQTSDFIQMWVFFFGHTLKPGASKMNALEEKMDFLTQGSKWTQTIK